MLMELTEKIVKLKAIMEEAKIFAAQVDDPISESTGEEILNLVVDALTYLDPEHYELYERALGLWDPA